VPLSRDLPTSTPRDSGVSDIRRDKLSPEGRSALMKRVRFRNTGPEQIVRRILHSLGLRFTINGPLNASLPSRPDIVLPRWKTVILVHGCFWHRHPGCPFATTPRNRAEFWKAKFEANVKRDKTKNAQLRTLNWRVVTVWECETRNRHALLERLKRLFRHPPKRQNPKPQSATAPTPTNAAVRSRGERAAGR
jgi:DNA mismatch endonuclease (patch repair protein)